MDRKLLVIALEAISERIEDSDDYYKNWYLSCIKDIKSILDLYHKENN